MCIRIVILIFSSFILCLLALGCTTVPEPRVIADRVFATDQLSAVITTYPGDPKDLTILSSEISNGPADDVEKEQITIEGRPGWRLKCTAPADADELTLDIVVLHAGKRFQVKIPFRRRKIYIAKQAKDVKRWITRRERIRDLGPVFDKKLFLTRNP